MDVQRSVDPVFLRHRDLKACVTQKLIGITLYKEINNVLPNCVKCVQQFFGIWRIYLNSTASRNKLIQLQFICIKESRIKIYESNPFDHKYVNHERILIKDLPYSECT